MNKALNFLVLTTKLNSTGIRKPFNWFVVKNDWQLFRNWTSRYGSVTFVYMQIRMLNWRTFIIPWKSGDSPNITFTERFTGFWTKKACKLNRTSIIYHLIVFCFLVSAHGSKTLETVSTIHVGICRTRDDDHVVSARDTSLTNTSVTTYRQPWFHLLSSARFKFF